MNGLLEETEVIISPSLSIGIDYLQRENLRGNYVHDWVKNYCKKNKITLGTSEGRIVLTFKTENQKDWFTRQGNKRYPFFEFL